MTAIVEAVSAELTALTSRMKRPTIEEVKARAVKINLPEIEVQKFWNHYQSNGWKVGKIPMKSLNAAMATWKINFESGVFCGGNGSKPNPKTIIEQQQERTAARIASGSL